MNPVWSDSSATAAALRPDIAACDSLEWSVGALLVRAMSARIFFLLWFAAPAFAQNSGVDNTLIQTNMDLQVEILPGCSITQPNGSNFGTLDFGTRALLNSAFNQQVTLQFTLQCAVGVPVAILMNGGGSGNINSRRMIRSGGTESIGYQLYIDNARSTVWDNSVGLSFTGDGQAHSYPVYGSVPAQSTPIPGTYLDNIQVTINF